MCFLKLVHNILVLYIIIGICVVGGFLFQSNITCYCNNENMLGSSHRKCVNSRCSSKSPLVDCYVQKVDENTIEKGCTYHPICVAYTHREKELGKKIIHCCRHPLCNQDINGTDLFFSKVQRGSLISVSAKGPSVLPKGMVLLIVIVPLSLLVITVLAVWKQFRKTNVTCTTALLGPAENGHYQVESLAELSSGTGSGLQKLVQQTISSQIALIECLRKGRFGDLKYRGTWHGTDVFIKIYFAGQKSLWCRECHFYQTVLLRHENILGFIAADSRESGTLTEHWLVCDYHPKGSLFNYIQNELFSFQRMVKVIFGIVCGLNHLHTEIVGSSRRKPAITHRALKTKHILMKSDDTCCISDLSLAMTQTTMVSNGMFMPASGTSRYHSPELLNRSMNALHFDSYLKADIYALGLCIWEICRRTKLLGKTEEYQPPFFEHLPSNAAVEDMFKKICVERKRPMFPDHWYQVEELQVVLKVMQECWCHDASARLPTLRIKKNIGVLIQTLDFSI